MLKIIIEDEAVQRKYVRLKDSMGCPTDSILVDILMDVYFVTREEPTEKEIVLGNEGADSSTVHINLDEQQKKPSRKKQ